MPTNPTPFQARVYELLKCIPKGKVSTYKYLAQAMGTQAYRAVGSALNKNPNAPEVPCHRIVNSDGRIGWYAFWVEKKISLLRKEGIEVTNGKVEDFEEGLYKF